MKVAQSLLKASELRYIGRLLLLVGLFVLVLTIAPARDAQAQSFEYGLRIGHAMYISDAQRAIELDKAKDAGATTVQIIASWRHLTREGHRVYDWTYLDTSVRQAEERGLKVHMQIEKIPRWMNSTGAPPLTSTELRQFREFMHDLSARYGTRPVRYEVWNEPNLDEFWKTGNGPNPKEWAAMLRSGYLGAKEGNPNVKITHAGLSQNDVGFLRHTYSAIKAYPDAPANNNFFDELGLHPYSFYLPDGTWPATATSPDSTHSKTPCRWTSKFGPSSSCFSDFPMMYDELVAQGDGHKKIYIGEFGYSHEETWMKAVPDSTRAGYLKTAYSMTKDVDYISGLSWFAYYANEIPPWHMVLNDGTEMQTFKAFREVAGVVAEPSEPVHTTAPIKRDTQIRSYNPNTAYGSVTSLNVDGDEPSASGHDSYALMEFDTYSIPAGAKVERAVLQLNVTNRSPHRYRMYALKKNWSSSNATWRKYRSDRYWATAGAKGTSDRGSEVIASVKPSATGAIDITFNAAGVALIQHWIDNPYENYGFIIASTSNADGFDFDSKEGSKPPALEVTSR